MQTQATNTVLTAMAKEAVKKPAPAPKAAGQMFKLGKKFNPKEGGKNPQVKSWEALCEAINKGKGKISYADAVAALVAVAGSNAKGFVRGRIRGGHLVSA